MEQSNDKKRKVKIIIPSIGKPVPEEIVKAATKIGDIFDNIIPDQDDDLPELPEKIKSFRDSLKFIEGISDTVIAKFQKFTEATEAFLSNSPDNNIEAEDFVKIVAAINFAVQSINSVDVLLMHLAEGFMPMAFDAANGITITFGELLDTKHDNDIDFTFE